MLTNGQFFSSFVFTLYLIVGLVALVGIAFGTYQAWRLSQPFRAWLKQSWLAHFIREMGAIVRVAKTHVKSFVASLVSAIIVRPWRAFVSFLTELGNALREVPWGICVGALVVCSLPFLVFFSVGMPLRSILGIVAVGSVVGTLCAPYSGWRYRALGPQKAIGVSLLTVIGGAYGSSMLVAFLIAVSSD